MNKMPIQSDSFANKTGNLYCNVKNQFQYDLNINNNDNNSNNNNNNNNDDDNVSDNRVLPERFEQVEKFCETELTAVSYRARSESFQFAIVVGKTFESEI
jgi:hypothetical protein